jgi:hypothetical protein
MTDDLARQGELEKPMRKAAGNLGEDSLKRPIEGGGRCVSSRGVRRFHRNASRSVAPCGIAGVFLEPKFMARYCSGDHVLPLSDATTVGRPQSRRFHHLGLARCYIGSSDDTS